MISVEVKNTNFYTVGVNKLLSGIPEGMGYLFYSSVENSAINNEYCGKYKGICRIIKYFGFFNDRGVMDTGINKSKYHREDFS